MNTPPNISRTKHLSKRQREALQLMIEGWELYQSYDHLRKEYFWLFRPNEKEKRVDPRTVKALFRHKLIIKDYVDNHFTFYILLDETARGG